MMAKPLPREIIQEARELVICGKSKYSVAKEMGIGVSTVYKHTKDIPSRQWSRRLSEETIQQIKEEVIKYKSKSLKNSWENNYWDDWPGLIPKPIRGMLSRKQTSILYTDKVNAIPLIPLRKFDWRPRREPYKDEKDQVGHLGKTCSLQLNNLKAIKTFDFIQRRYKLGGEGEEYPPKITVLERQDITKTSIYLPPYTLKFFMENNN